MTLPDLPTCFLFDNGSLRAASTLGLRRVAGSLARMLDADVRPVSLLHSSGVPVDQLEGRPAELLEPALQAFLRNGGRSAVALPLFFGPSAALTDYVPARLAALRGNSPGAAIALARCLVDPEEPDDTRIAHMLADAVRVVAREQNLRRPRVLLTDHGSPQAPVTDVRDHLGWQLRAILGEEAAEVGVASMERRAGAKFDFNEPLLERALRRPPFDQGEVIVALQFLQPGRHAGAGGDIAGICAAAERERPGLKTYLTRPIGADDRLVGILAERYREAAL